MSSPIICFGQQPCGIFPRRFLFAKIQTARRLQQELGGEIVFFYHDSDHDRRETATILRERSGDREFQINFTFANAIQKLYSPLFAKRVLPEWKEKTARQLPNYIHASLLEHFNAVEADNAADFCLEMYRRLGLLDGITVARSGDPEFRARARRSTTTLSTCNTKASWCGRDATAIACASTKAATLTSICRCRNTMRSRSAPRATRACGGCNPSSAARTTSTAPARSSI
jgi:hypothetical protein